MKKGYSLIELIICISLITIISTFGGFSVKKYNEYTNKMEVEQCSFSIVSLINSAKLYCKQADHDGKIIFYKEDKEICFYCNQKLISRIVIPKGLDLNEVNTPGTNNYIYIDRRGITEDACTIFFKDKFKKNYYITMNVGSTYVEIKKE